MAGPEGPKGNSVLERTRMKIPPDTPTAQKAYRPERFAWLSIYTGFSFIMLFCLNYLFEAWTFRRLLRTPDLLKTGDIRWAPPISRWYLQKWTLVIASYNEPYEVLSPGSIILWGLLLTAVAVFIGFWTYRSGNKGLKTLLLPTVLYIGVPIAISQSVYYDMCGIQITCFIYLALIYAMRGAALFNPHLTIGLDHCCPK